ncbi:MAG: RagB/SusD family nutrient uptake outer membrane protein [Bacteroidales bacterium]|nr:RagB/SusD family nutrient uptake outer membrane protein [Bacteroidales bacterium]
MKSIKFLIYLFTAFVILLSAISCEDVLEPVIYSDLTPDNFFKTEEDLNNAVIALYNPFSTNWGTTDQGVNIYYASLYNIDQKTYVCRSMLTTDELYDNPTWDANLVNFTWGPSTWLMYDFSGSLYEANYPKIRFVARATEVIDRIPDATDVPELVRDKYLAEAKVLRAWLMYVLYDFYGPVNVRLDPNTLTDTTITPRPSTEEYCLQIETDLKDALAISSSSFPENYNDDPGNWGRVSKGVARMLLLKLYMHNRQWAKAETIAKEIIDLNYYSILPNYEDVFNVSMNKEVIYGLPCNSGSPNYWLAPIFPGEFSSGYAGSTLIDVKINGWYGFWMPWSHFNQFDTADLRRNTIIYEYRNTNNRIRNQANSGPMLGAIPMKYTKIPSGDVGPAFTMDMVVFRYAEVLLSLAEAINNQRGPEEALPYVKIIRDRAGLTTDIGREWDITTIPTREVMKDSLLVERGRELYCEGSRRQDLVRNGKFIEYALARGAFGATDADTIFPIPQVVITEGRGIIQQNPGY